MVPFHNELLAAVPRCYVTRTSLKCVSPGLLYGPGSFPSNGSDVTRWNQGDDTRVCFQYSAIDSAPVGSKGYKTNDELYKQLEDDLKSYGAQEVEVGPAPHCVAYVSSGETVQASAVEI